MRKRKRLLREKRSESDDDDSESEDEAPDIGEEYEEEEDEEIVLQASAWELVIDEKPTNERHRILGGSKSLPKAKNLPQNSYDDPCSLFLAMYGDRFFHEVLDATNSKALKLKSHDIMFQRYYPLQLSDIFEFFAHLLVICCEKNRDNDDVRRFLSK